MVAPMASAKPSTDGPMARPAPAGGCLPEGVCARRCADSPLTQELFTIHNMIMRIGDRLVSDIGLTSSRWLMLSALDHYEEPPMVSTLSNDVLLSVQNVSRMIVAMERDELVERFHRPGHGRAAFVRMTELGRERLELARTQGRLFSENFLDGVSRQEIQSLEASFEKLIGNLTIMEQTLASGEPIRSAGEESRTDGATRS